MNRRKRGNKRYKTERAFLVRFSTISILIGLIQFSHFFIALVRLHCLCNSNAEVSFTEFQRCWQKICRNYAQCAWLLNHCVVGWNSVLFFFCCFSALLSPLHLNDACIYIYKFLSMSIAAWPLIIRIGFPRAEHTFAFFAVGRSSIAKLLIQYVKTLR